MQIILLVNKNIVLFFVLFFLSISLPFDTVFNISISYLIWQKQGKITQINKQNYLIQAIF